MAGALRKMGLYLGIVEDDEAYDDEYEPYEVDATPAPSALRVTLPETVAGFAGIRGFATCGADVPALPLPAAAFGLSAPRTWSHHTMAAATTTKMALTLRTRRTSAS